MKKLMKIACSVIFLLAGAVSAFAFDASESLGFYANLGKTQRFIGGSFTFQNPINLEGFEFQSETYVNLGASTCETSITLNGEEVERITDNGFFMMLGENLLYSFDCGFFAPRVGFGADFGVYNGYKENIKFGGMAGLLVGVELFADKVVSIVCDIRPSMDFYGEMRFAAPLNISVRLHNARIKL